MLRRAAAALLIMERNFRKLMRYQDLWMLKTFLDENQSSRQISRAFLLGGGGYRAAWVDQSISLNAVTCCCRSVGFPSRRAGRLGKRAHRAHTPANGNLTEKLTEEPSCEPSQQLAGASRQPSQRF